MTTKSHGQRSGTRSKYKNAPKFKVNKFIKKFEIGQKVAIVTDSSSHKGMPFKRFHGLTGTVLSKRGNSYIIEIKDINKKKQIITKPEHLKSLQV